MSVLSYSSTILTLTKRLEKKLDRNYTRMLRAVLNKLWTAVVRLLTPHLRNMTYLTVLRTNDELTSNILLFTPIHAHNKTIKPVKIIYIIMCGHWMSSRGFEFLGTRERERERERENEMQSVLLVYHDDTDDDCYTHIHTHWHIIQSVAAIEYTDCTSAEV